MAKIRNVNREGWIKLHRKIIDNELYFAERFTRMQAWFDLLLLANHKSATIFLRGVEIKLNAGELAYSIQSLSNRWRWNERTVKRFLNWLQTKEMIHTRISNVTTIIAIIKYADYQQNTEQTTDQNTEQLLSRIHTDNNDKNGKNTPPYPPKGDSGCAVASCNGLERFWNAYPRKQGREKFKNVWKGMSPSEALLEKMLKAIEVQKKSPDWKRESGRFIPSPTRWIAEKRWEDLVYQEPIPTPSVSQKRREYTDGELGGFVAARKEGLEKIKKILNARGKSQ